MNVHELLRNSRRKQKLENIRTFFGCRLSLSLNLENLDTRLLFGFDVEAATLPESAMSDL